MRNVRNRRLLGIAAALMLAGGSYAAGRATASIGPSGPVQAAFAARSYSPGSRAVLQLRGHAASLLVRFYRAGAGSSGLLDGQPVAAGMTVERPGSSLGLKIGNWPSGL